MVEDREIVELLIRDHEKEGYVKDAQEIICTNVLKMREGSSAVTVCYRDKECKNSPIVVIRGYVNGERVNASYMYMGYELVKAILKAMESERE